MIFATIATIVLAFGAFVCYVSCLVAARADKIDEQYWEEHKDELHGRS